MIKKILLTFIGVLLGSVLAQASYAPLPDTGSSSNIGVGTFSAYGGKLIVMGGNVGINSLAPGQQLDVFGTIRATAFVGDGTALMGITGLTTGYIPKASSATSINDSVVYQSSNNIGIGTTGVFTGKLLVYGGNVGIGTVAQSPSAMLNVSTKAAQDLFKVEDNGDGDDSPFVINSVGNVGIGTSDPQTGILSIIGGNVGVGTATPQGALTVTNGNVGIGTWSPSNLLDVVRGNIGIGTQNAIYMGSNIVFQSKVPTTLSIGVGANSSASTSSLYIGYNAGNNSTVVAANNTFVGVQAGENVTGSGNTYTGYLAGQNAGTGTNNSGFGYRALKETGNGSNNAAVGADALKSGTGGISNNSALGYNTLGSMTSGSDNTAMGYNAGNANLTGSFNTFIGSEAGNVGTGSALSKAVAIGYNAQVTLSSSMALGGTGADAVNVGIATHSPASRLTVNGGVGIGTVSAYLRNAAPTTGGMIIAGNVGIATFNPFGGSLIVATGNVGIGSLTPGTVLDVQGTTRTTGFQLTTTPAAGYILTSNGVGVGTWMPLQATATPGGSSPQIQFNNGNSFDGVSGSGVDSNGNVGIGTTSVGSGRLMVYGGNVGIGTVAQTTTALLHLSTQAAQDLFRIDDNGDGDTTPMIVTSSGNVGIGTISPNKLLEIVGGNVGIGTTADAYALVVNNGIYTYKEYDNGSKAGAFAISWDNGIKQKVTLTGSTSHAITALNPPSAGIGNVMLKIVQGDANNTISSWPASVKWPNGAVPSISTTINSIDLVSCYYDGTSYYCDISLAFQ